MLEREKEKIRVAILLGRMYDDDTARRLVRLDGKVKSFWSIAGLNTKYKKREK